jgi:hypothetical protein
VYYHPFMFDKTGKDGTLVAYRALIQVWQIMAETQRQFVELLSSNIGEVNNPQVLRSGANAQEFRRHTIDGSSGTRRKQMMA